MSYPIYEYKFIDNYVHNMHILFGPCHHNWRRIINRPLPRIEPGHVWITALLPLHRTKRGHSSGLRVLRIRYQVMRQIAYFTPSLYNNTPPAMQTG